MNFEAIKQITHGVRIFITKLIIFSRFLGEDYKFESKG